VLQCKVQQQEIQNNANNNEIDNQITEELFN